MLPPASRLLHPFGAGGRPEIRRSQDFFGLNRPEARRIRLFFLLWVSSLCCRQQFRDNLNDYPIMRMLLFFLLTLPALSHAKPNYDAWNALLEKYVTADGRVDYKGLKADSAALNRITEAFSAQTPTENWSRNQRLAFWINVYNAFTIKLIVDNYPIGSITLLDGGKPWEVKRVRIGRTVYSLNEIENDIIRPEFKDARIHFALNCAAKSCPPLYNKAFLPSTLDKQLDQRTRVYLHPFTRSWSASTVELSKIFEWYRDDFEDLGLFLKKYTGVKIAPGAAIKFTPYDWNLNE